MEGIIGREKKNVQEKAVSRVQMAALLTGAAVTSALVYWFAFVKAVPLSRWIHFARLDRFFLFRGGDELLLHFVLAFFSLGVLYLLGYQFAAQLKGKTAWAIVIGGSVVFGVLMLYMYPFDSSDLFDNIIHGRMVAFTGDNPFSALGTMLRGDPFFKYMGWPKSPAAYGPLWEVVGGAAIKITGYDKMANVLSMKVIPALFMVGATFVIAAILRKVDPEKAPARTLLFAWNPVVLYETWGNGHNDMAMVFWIIVAAWAMYNKRFTIAILSLLVGGLFKYLPVLLIPAVGLIALQNIPKRGWLKFILGTGALGAAMVAASYWPFWEGLETLSITRRAELYSSTLPATIYHVLVPVLGKIGSGRLVSITALAATLAFTLWQAFRVRKQDSFEGFISAAFATFMFYLLVTNLWFQQWYAIWIIALIPLLKPGFATQLAQVFGFSVLSKQFIIGPAIFWQSSWPDQPWLELTFTLGVLGASWAFLIYVYYARKRAKRKVEEAPIPVVFPIPERVFLYQEEEAWPFVSKEAEKVYERRYEESVRR